MVAPIKINQILWRDKGHCGLIAASLQEWSFFFVPHCRNSLWMSRSSGIPGDPGAKGPTEGP